MKLHVIGVSVMAATGLSLAVASFAHHSQSEFDPQLTVEIEGAVSKLEWRSPHARLYVDVVDEDGETVSWNFELPSPTTLMRRGWSRNSLAPGDAVSVTGFRARNFPTIAIARTVRDEDGNGIFTGITEVN
ncbi:MAG: DUF6152 family protein [Gammaproteobacteria bacterium]